MFSSPWKVEEVQRFLWFVTGSAVCFDTPIQITFNGLSGLGRRPVAHTCDCTLELTCTYTPTVISPLS